MTSINLSDALKSMYDDKVDALTAQIYGQREEILRAFIAKYGCGPDELEQVEERGEDGTTKWHVRLRQLTAEEDRKAGELLAEIERKSALGEIK
jgi:hypothetical protein